MDRRHGSGHPRTVSILENMDLVEKLVCSQEEWPQMHLAPRKIKQTGISWSSMGRIVKKRNLAQFRHWKTPKMSEGTQNRRETHAGSLGKRFKSNICMMEKTVCKTKNISLLKFLSICRMIMYMVKEI